MPDEGRTRSHMDCFTSPNNCWVGDDATCPMNPANKSGRVLTCDAEDCDDPNTSEVECESVLCRRDGRWHTHQVCHFHGGDPETAPARSTRGDTG